MNSLFKNPRLIIFSVFILTLYLGFKATELKIAFNFEQFFPEDDADLDYYRNFTNEFEKDDNFLLLAVKNNGKSVFDSSFLLKIQTLTDSLLSYDNIRKVQSITSLKNPVKTPFGYSLLPAIHIDDSSKLKQDEINIQNDERYKGSIINDNGDATAILIKTEDHLTISQCDNLMNKIRNLMDSHKISENNYHLLGHTYFQSEMVRLQKEEVFISTIISAILVYIILILVFGKLLTATISMIGIGASFIIFMGTLALMGRELSLMSALYPVLILIVGCSDVIHLVSKYLSCDFDENNKIEVMKKVFKEIGTATFLTSATSAVGFVSLLTSRLYVLREFGVNAGLGVMLAFVVVMLLVPCLLLLFKKEQLFHTTYTGRNIDNIIMKAYKFSYYKSGTVIVIIGLAIVSSLYGISRITTDYKLIDNLPRNEKVTTDFMYFEKEFSGFRPFEVAVYAKAPYKISDFEIMNTISTIENKLSSYESIKSTMSIATIFKSLNMIENSNQKRFYIIPLTKDSFDILKPMFNKITKNEFDILLNKDQSATRISCKVEDVGAEKIKEINKDFDDWIAKNIDSSKLEVKRTGTSLILDKNSEYVTSNLMQGLVLSIFLISIFMAFVVKSWKMLIVALIPNIIPLFFAGALMGYFGIALEAGVSIVFAVIYGIAVDDTIHFIARYNQCISSGLSVEESIKQTFTDCGRALVITSVILFFGFLVMLFSKHPPSVTVGVLIAFTLISALLCDLYLLPILIRKVFGKNQSKI